MVGAVAIRADLTDCDDVARIVAKAFHAFHGVTASGGGTVDQCDTDGGFDFVG